MPPSPTGMAGARDLGECCGECRAPGMAVCVLQKRQLEKSDGELPGSFEQRVQVMLHRIGVTKGPAAEGKKQQVGRGQILHPKGGWRRWSMGWGCLCRCCLCPLSCHPTLFKGNEIRTPMHCMVSVCPSFPVCTHPLQPPQRTAAPCPLYPSSLRVMPP